MNEIEEIKARLRDINIVSYSAGKDSTTTLQLVLEAIKGTDKELIIVNSDTLMEIPFYQEYVDCQKARLQQYINKYRIKASVVTVTPAIDKSFWVCTLGLGYPAAHMGFRWCTGVLKIDPITKFTEDFTAGRDYMTFIGVRRAESALRDRIYPSKDIDEHRYAPILEWSNDDVWSFLLTEPCPWGTHEDLVRVYRYSSDECVYGEKQGVCVGNARYGCWACPLQKSTQLDLISYFTGDPRYKLLKGFKEVLIAMANNTAYRSRIRRNGEEGAGPFLVIVRESLHRRLKELERKTGWQLIRPEEEEIIFKHWMTDQEVHNIPDDTRPVLFPFVEGAAV